MRSLSGAIATGVSFVTGGLLGGGSTPTLWQLLRRWLLRRWLLRWYPIAAPVVATPVVAAPVVATPAVATPAVATPVVGDVVEANWRRRTRGI
jgi:hypothetical protein